jgi:hypothetical protein
VEYYYLLVLNLPIFQANRNRRTATAALTNTKKKIMKNYWQLTKSSKVNFAFTATSKNLAFSPGTGASERFKNLLRPFFRPLSTHAHQQSSNPSRDPVH